jgi:hypothetical protein
MSLSIPSSNNNKQSLWVKWLKHKLPMGTFIISTNKYHIGAVATTNIVLQPILTLPSLLKLIYDISTQLACFISQGRYVPVFITPSNILCISDTLTECFIIDPAHNNYFCNINTPTTNAQPTITLYEFPTTISEQDRKYLPPEIVIGGDIPYNAVYYSFGKIIETLWTTIKSDIMETGDNPPAIYEYFNPKMEKFIQNATTTNSGERQLLWE